MLDDARKTKGLIHVVTFIRLRSYRSVLGFMSTNMRIFKYATGAEGFVSGGIKAMLWRKEFWTYTTWDDREAMMRFVTTPPHSWAAGRVHELAAPGSCYVEWETYEPMEWSEGLARLRKPTRYFVTPTPESPMPGPPSAWPQ